MPRLLVLASTYPRWPGDHEPGFVHELAHRLTDHFDVCVLTPHHAGAKLRERLDCVDVIRYRYAPSRLETLIYDGGMTTNLRRTPAKWLLVPLLLATQFLATWRLLRTWQPDVIHAHWLVPQGLVVAVLGLVTKRCPPFVVTSHGADLFALRARPAIAIKRFVARRAAAITVVSQAMVTPVMELGVAAEKVSVQPMGVDLKQRFTPDPATPRADNELLFVGRLVEKKGLRYLLEALPVVAQKYPDIRLKIAGYGPEEAALRKQAERLGISGRIEWLGAVEQANLPELYRRATLFIAPFIQATSGDQEGLGLVTVEAIGCGCPVLVSDLPAVRDVVSEPERLMRPADSFDIANKIIKVLNRSEKHRTNTDQRLRTSVMARFDWGQVTDAYAQLLRGTIHRQCGKPKNRASGNSQQQP